MRSTARVAPSQPRSDRCPCRGMVCTCGNPSARLRFWPDHLLSCPRAPISLLHNHHVSFAFLSEQFCSACCDFHTTSGFLGCTLVVLASPGVRSTGIAAWVLFSRSHQAAAEAPSRADISQRPKPSCSLMKFLVRCPGFEVVEASCISLLPNMADGSTLAVKCVPIWFPVPFGRGNMGPHFTS